MDSKAVTGFEISSDGRRFAVLITYFLVAFSSNSAERLKIWFRADVRFETILIYFTG